MCTYNTKRSHTDHFEIQKKNTKMDSELALLTQDSPKPSYKFVRAMKTSIFYFCVGCAVYCVGVSTFVVNVSVSDSFVQFHIKTKVMTVVS